VARCAVTCFLAHLSIQLEVAHYCPRLLDFCGPRLRDQHHVHRLVDITIQGENNSWIRRQRGWSFIYNTRADGRHVITALGLPLPVGQGVRGCFLGAQVRRRSRGTHRRLQTVLCAGDYRIQTHLEENVFLSIYSSRILGALARAPPAFTGLMHNQLPVKSPLSSG
jgi:hypothetical protein